ncbi:transposase [Hymenobacter lutimineralis]|uniref:Transposase n=1 Tax=Hymenobacter lutimineralis TaxID=2606448 RepID=A0A5D6VA19_9BACT|nr:transposase [Hymenobacter lutimineralis]
MPSGLVPQTVAHRFRRWAQAGVWQALL